MNMVDMDDDDDDDTTETQHRQYPPNLNPSSSSDHHHHHKDDTDSNGTKPRNQTSAYRPPPPPPPAAAALAPPSMKINARIGSYSAADSEEDEEDENNNDHDDSEDDDGNDNDNDNDNDNGDDDEEEDDEEEEEEEEDDEDGTSILPPSFKLAAAETGNGVVPSSQKRKKKKRREYAVEGIAQENTQMKTPKSEPTEDLEEEEEDDDDEGSRGKRMFQKRKPLSAFGPSSGNGGVETSSSKKPKKKYNNSWTRSGSRRWCRRAKSNGNGSNHSAGGAGGAAPPDETVAISPVLRFPDDASDMKICLSKVYKAEKVELSDDRMTAGSCKGFRMVRATRGVLEGTWFFEIKVVFLGLTGHTRLGWTTEKGDLQAPVGYDANSYGYRDIDGTKIHKALREKYGEEGYKEGDVIGCYVSLPEGSQYAPKPPRFVWHRGQRYVLAPDKDEEPKVVPDSKIIFFKNGVSQGVAFTELTGERYYPAASMYTLPNQPNCLVRFNFGPDFECFPQDFGGHPSPKPLIDAPYCGFDGEASTNDANVENPPPAQQNDQSEKKV